MYNTLVIFITYTYIGPPIINFISSHTVVSEGKEVNLSCTATNDDDARDPLQIMWFNPDGMKIDSKITHVSIHYINHTALGQLQSVLSFHSVNRSDDGEYTCKAFNHIESHTEPKITLTVQCKLSFVCSQMSCFVV